MSNGRETFIELCLKGEVKIEDIDDFVDQWHDSEVPESLQVYLGMDDQEYGLWLTRPDRLSEILSSRRNHTDLGVTGAR